MKIKEIGEKAFLHSLLPKLVKAHDFINGFGHDASILDIGLQDTAIAMKIDRAGKPVATLNGWTDYRLWGRLAVTANCSDILAVGGEPKGFMISISIPRSFRISSVEEIVMGAEEECLRNGITFLGGDTKEAIEPQVVGAAVGIVKKNYYHGRKIAKNGDYLILAGNLGGFVGSYLQVKDTNDFCNEYVEYMAYPKARWNEATKINRKQLANGGIDLSDGLFDALQNIIAPGNGAVIKIDSLPYHNMAKRSSIKYNIPLFNFAFSVGDWAMLYTVSPKRINEVRTLSKERSVELTEIGRVIDKTGIFGIDRDRNLYEIDGIVNDNFNIRMEDEGNYFESIKKKVSLRLVSNQNIKNIIESVI